MRKSNIIVDINTKNDVLAIAKIDKGEVSAYKGQEQAHAPVICHLLNGVSTVLNQLMKAGRAKERVSIIVPEAIAIRMNEARKLKDAGAEEIATALFKDWMANDEKTEPLYEKAIGSFAQAYSNFVAENGNNHQFVNARQLYRYELEGNIADLGKTVKLAGSVNEELGVSVKAINGNMENNMLNGEFDVQSTHYRTRAGEVVEQKWAIRKVQVLKDGTPVSVNTTDVLKLLDEGAVTINESADSANALINALRLRTENIRLGLPHVKVISKLPTMATDGTLAF